MRKPKPSRTRYRRKPRPLNPDENDESPERWQWADDPINGGGEESE